MKIRVIIEKIKNLFGTYKSPQQAINLSDSRDTLTNTADKNITSVQNMDTGAAKSLQQAIDLSNSHDTVPNLADKNIKSEQIMDTAALLSKLKTIACDTTEYKISHGAMCYCPARIERRYKSSKCNSCKCKIGHFEVKKYADLVKISGQIKKTGIAEIKLVCIDCLIRMCQSGLYNFDITKWDVYDSLVSDYKSCNNIGNVNIDSERLLLWKCEHQRRLRDAKNKGLDTENDDFDDNDIEDNNKFSFMKNSFERYKYTEPEYIVFLFKPADCEKPHLSVTYQYYLDYFLAFIENRTSWESWNDSTIILRDNIDVVERLTGLNVML